MGRRLAAATAGTVLIAAAVLAFALGKHPVVAGTNTASPFSPALSVGSGETRCQLISRVPAGVAVVRVMPNTPALVRTGISGMYALADVAADDRKAAETLMESVGEKLWFDEERALDAVGVADRKQGRSKYGAKRPK